MSKLGRGNVAGFLLIVRNSTRGGARLGTEEVTRGGVREGIRKGSKDGQVIVEEGEK